MSKAGIKKTVAAILTALMAVNAVKIILPEITIRASYSNGETAIQDKNIASAEDEKLTVLTPSVPIEREAEVKQQQLNGYSQKNGEFTVSLKGGGHTVSYVIYLYNVKNLEPAEGCVKRIEKIGSTNTVSDTKPQWKAVRVDNNDTVDKKYFDLSFEELILRHDGPCSKSQGWSGVQLKIKFNIGEHVYRVSQSVEDTEEGRLCLIASDGTQESDLERQMIQEGNHEAGSSCANIRRKLQEHSGAAGITGYIQCNAYNCGLADYNGDGNYAKGKLSINFNVGRECLKIDPNKGVYAHTAGGKKVNETGIFTLAEKVCNSSTNIQTPVRDGYIFAGWEVSHKDGAKGSYDISSKKYTHCSTSGTGVTILKAVWKKNEITSSPVPKPTKTVTPVPQYVQTVEYYVWSEMEQRWISCKDKEVYLAKKGETFQCHSLAEKNLPDGYYLSDIIVQSAGATKWDIITKPYLVHTSAVIHINYKPSQSTLRIEPNGGEWKGSKENQNVIQSYGTKLHIPEPVRDKYKFIRWNRFGRNGTMTSDTEACVYFFGKNHGAVDKIQAQWVPWKFKIRYARNEPSKIEKNSIQFQEDLNIEEKKTLCDVGTDKNAKFMGWCLAKGNWNREKTKLESVYWLKEDGTFAAEASEVGEKGLDTTKYKGKIFPNLASVQELVSYITFDGEELTLVGKWLIDVDFDAKEGINTAVLERGQHDIAPDLSFYLINEIPSLRGVEFAKWWNPDNNEMEDKGAIIDEGYGKNTTLHAIYKYYLKYQKADGSIIEKNNAGREKEFEKEYDKVISISDVVYPTTGNTEGHHYTREQSWQVTADSSERYKYADAVHYPDKNYSNTYKQGENALVNRSVILKATEEANTYTIKYHANNTSASTASEQDWSKMKEQNLIYGNHIVLRDISQSALPGYEFVGWNTRADGRGVNFSNKESSTVKQFLKKAGADVNENGAVINLYAQWQAKSYTITFCTNKPTMENNTHNAGNEPMLHGTAIMEYVWDNYVTNNKIEELDIPIASLKGWHQRFPDSLWYTKEQYKEPGKALKEGVRLDCELLGKPGDKTVYAQWEANTYTVYYDGNGAASGGRGVIQGKVEAQRFIYDKPEKLRKNGYTKQDEAYRYHDDKRLQENFYATKYNSNAVNSYKYCWLGWCRQRHTEGEEAVSKESEIIPQSLTDTEKVWNFTDANQGKVILYAFWNGIPNITTRAEETHFDRYQGAVLTAADMKELVRTYDLEEGEALKVSIKSISYYEGDKRVKTINYPEDDYLLDTTLPQHLCEDGKYKIYTITFVVKDKHNTVNYAEEQKQKEAVYTGKIYYNNEPVMQSYNGQTSLYDRYFYLKEIKQMGEEALEEELKRQIDIIDKEDEAYKGNQDNDLYLGRLSDKPELKVLQLSDLYQKSVDQKKYWSLQEKEQGKKLQYTIHYTDIFGKEADKTCNMYVIDSANDKTAQRKQGKQMIRFISKEYFDTLEQDSQWYKEENRKKLEDMLKSKKESGEMYELQKGEYVIQP